MNPNDHETVLARIAELESTNARLTAENEALRAPERIEEEPAPRRSPPMKGSDWLTFAVSGLFLLLMGLYQWCT
jgi:hypothetical protein